MRTRSGYYLNHYSMARLNLMDCVSSEPYVELTINTLTKIDNLQTGFALNRLPGAIPYREPPVASNGTIAPISVFVF
jgi:hypothetical protein